jgi:hypothetical protein
MSQVNLDTGKFLKVCSEFGVDEPNIDKLIDAVIGFKNGLVRHATGIVKSLSDEQIDAHVDALIKYSEEKRRRGRK